MKSIQVVVMPVDFSPRDVAAAHYAAQLYKKHPFRLILLHVLPPADYEMAMLEAGGQILDTLMEERRTAAKASLAKTCFAELQGIPVERVMVEGFPSERIVQFAAEEKADLILLPTHGYGPFRRFLLGSVTAKILHDATCPVFTGAHLSEIPESAIHFDKIAAAVDLSVNSTRVISAAAELAQLFGAKLMVLHAMPEIGSHIGLTLEPSYNLHFESAVRARLVELTQGLGPGVETLIQMGDPAATIGEMAQSAGVDLLVIGRGTSQGLARVAEDSYGIIRHSGMPVLSV
jgi:nucleotide-binding universal stress UspA family protein